LYCVATDVVFGGYLVDAVAGGAVGVEHFFVNAHCLLYLLAEFFFSAHGRLV